MARFIVTAAATSASAIITEKSNVVAARIAGMKMMKIEPKIIPPADRDVVLSYLLRHPECSAPPEDTEAVIREYNARRKRDWKRKERTKNK